MNTLSRTFATAVAYIKDHPELLTSYVVIAFIPFAFLFSGEQFLSVARSHQEQLERNRIGLLHDLLSAYVRAVNYDPVRITNQLRTIADQNTDITALELVREEPDGMRIISALDTHRIGTLVENDEVEYHIAHLASKDTSVIVPYAKEGIRYWHSVRHLQDENGYQYYLVSHTSNELIDQQFADHAQVAYLWLSIIVTFVVWLLYRQVRLVDYAALYRETRRTQEIHEEFMRLAAHELRAPLTAINGYASMIREQEMTNATVREYANRIQTSAQRLRKLVTELLDVARIQSGKLSVARARVLTKPLIERVIQELAPAAQERGNSLNIEPAPSEIVAVADSERLYQVLVNVISNAIKYTNHGNISIAVIPKNKLIEIRVKDTGVGMTSSDQQKLFSPFFRAEEVSDTTKQMAGTGLGMWISKQLVELMGGSIGIESIHHIGTHVVITLPRAE